MNIATMGAGVVIATIGLAGCSALYGGAKRSETVADASAGLNGGFEIVKSGLPVNWLVYTPRTIPSGDYDLVVDTVQYKAGRQSLKFVVRKCAPDGGWHSPGFTRELDVSPGGRYRIGFWVKNDGAEFVAKVGGIAATQGRYETIVRSSDTISAWKHYKHVFTVPREFTRLRFELNVVRPGTFWVDEVTIERL